MYRCFAALVPVYFSISGVARAADQKAFGEDVSTPAVLAMLGLGLLIAGLVVHRRMKRRA